MQCNATDLSADVVGYSRLMATNDLDLALADSPQPHETRRLLDGELSLGFYRTLTDAFGIRRRKRFANALYCVPAGPTMDSAKRVR